MGKDDKKVEAPKAEVKIEPTCSHFWKTHANVDRCARCGVLKEVPKVEAPKDGAA
jgi:hypothetical protein